MENPLEARFLKGSSRTRKDLLLLLVLSFLVITASVAFNLPLSIVAFIQANNSSVLDDLVTLAVVLVFALALFSYRRWKEREDEIREALA